MQGKNNCNDLPGRCNPCLKRVVSLQNFIIMKNSIQFAAGRMVAVIAVAFLFSACKKDITSKKTQTYTIYTPTYQSKASVLGSLNGNPSQSIEHAGKLYIKDNFIYLNDVNKGIHVIDNSNPSHPVQVAFLSIPGNLDIAVKGNILYADMYSGLLVLNIANPRNAGLITTVDNFFKGRMYLNGHPAELNGTVAVEWKQKDTTVEVPEYPGGCMFCEGDVLAMQATAFSNTKSAGTAGSMAGMVLMNDYLYAITEMHSMGIIDISNAAAPVVKNDFFAGFDLQTIFPFEGKIFLGSAVGMFMYDVTDPEAPVSLGEFRHGRACDPVITDGHYAYITLHAGDGCGGDANELHVVDINDILNSQLVKTYPMIKPTGLSKDGNLLFICDDTEVKVYNAANPGSLQLLKKISAKEPYDIITGNNKAMLVCSNGLYQYDYSNLANIRQLSFLAAKK